MNPQLSQPTSPVLRARPKYLTWASLPERTFAVDVLACPECGGRLRLIATITDTPARGFRRAGSSVIDKIPTHLRLPTEPPAPMPAKLSEWLPGIETPPDWITQ